MNELEVVPNSQRSKELRLQQRGLEFDNFNPPPPFEIGIFKDIS